MVEAAISGRELAVRVPARGRRAASEQAELAVSQALSWRSAIGSWLRLRSARFVSWSGSGGWRRAACTRCSSEGADTRAAGGR